MVKYRLTGVSESHVKDSARKAGIARQHFSRAHEISPHIFMSRVDRRMVTGKSV